MTHGPHRLPRLVTLAVVAACAPDVGPDAVDPGVRDPTPGFSRVAILADPHVIGDVYDCCESPGLDTESIYKTRRRLETTRDLIEAIDPPPERVFVLGDVFHQNYHYPAIEDYLDPSKGSAALRSKEILDAFQVPVELLWGNHDYEVPTFSREFAHQVFDAVFHTAPYHAVDHGGFRFLLLNSQLGRTWDSDPMNAFFDDGVGSFGREQLAWAADQLADGRPTFLMFHHPPIELDDKEDPSGPWPDIFALVAAHHDQIAGIFVGHMHRWIEMSPAFGGIPTYVVGSVRYDADNFWLLELDDDGGDYDIADHDKAAWGTPYGYGTAYDDGQIVIDLSGAAEEDPAGPWDGWTTPPPWPPE